MPPKFVLAAVVAAAIAIQVVVFITGIPDGAADPSKRLAGVVFKKKSKKLNFFKKMSIFFSKTAILCHVSKFSQQNFFVFSRYILIGFGEPPIVAGMLQHFFLPIKTQMARGHALFLGRQRRVK